jgi:hypothetical protein
VQEEADAERRSSLARGHGRRYGPTDVDGLHALRGGLREVQGVSAGHECPATVERRDHRDREALAGQVLGALGSDEAWLGERLCPVI